jgi:hypothetical protein
MCNSRTNKEAAVNPSEAVLLGKEELEQSPEAHRIRRLAAWGKGIVILPLGWETLAKHDEALTDDQRAHVNAVYSMAIKDSSPTPDVGHKGTVAGSGGGLNRFGRTSLTAEDAQYIADNLPGFEVWDFEGNRYVKASE